MKIKDSQKTLRVWLTEKLQEHGYGVAAALARALSTDSASIMPMQKPPTGRSHCGITGDELVKMAEFFGEIPPGFASVAIYPSQCEFLDLARNLSKEETDWLLPSVKVLHQQISKAPLSLSRKGEKK
ncbi:hypothetical protein [Candidatus Tokpelaia sp.]|uniref:hypothetical protein n=1 Tax=Candidatus Tokpelaia sp. TaxID=2233777 RepID=UPI00123C4F50|nr:hypothetical protein [Candidatus Tokpelaia sp.]